MSLPKSKEVNGEFKKWFHHHCKAVYVENKGRKARETPIKIAGRSGKRKGSADRSPLGKTESDTESKLLNVGLGLAAGWNGDAGSVAPGDAAARGGHEPQGAAPLGDVQRQRKKSVKDFAATKKRILLKKVFKNI